VFVDLMGIVSGRVKFIENNSVLDEFYDLNCVDWRKNVNICML